MTTKTKESLLLKWGTVKGWDDISDQSMEILRRFFADGIMTGHPNEGRRAILCELIDQFDGTIRNNWSGEIMSKDEAKNYVNEHQS
jgi:hypothetical protein